MYAIQCENCPYIIFESNCVEIKNGKGAKTPQRIGKQILPREVLYDKHRWQKKKRHLPKNLGKNKHVEAYRDVLRKLEKKEI